MRIISGIARGRKIEAPEGKNTRPTLDRVRENLFNILQMRVRSASVLDLFAGSGALSFEALSRGASHAVLCDHDRSAHRIEMHNAEVLGFADRTDFLCCDWRSALRNIKTGSRRFDLVFLDPPYRMLDLQIVFSELIPVLSDKALVVAEHEAGQKILFDSRYTLTDQRKWGFCGVSFFTIDPLLRNSPETEEPL